MKHERAKLTFVTLRKTRQPLEDTPPHKGTALPACPTCGTPTQALTDGRARKIVTIDLAKSTQSTRGSTYKSHGKSGVHDEAEDRTIRNNAGKMQ